MPPRLARLLAVVAAVALVGGAFVVRGALSNDDPDAVRAGIADPQEREVSEFRLVCDPDVGEAACEAVASLPGVVEVVPLALQEVIDDATGDGAPPDWDLWLTLDPMPGVLDTARSEAQLSPMTSADPVALASSPLAVLADPERLAEVCPAGEPTWDCLAQAARPPIAAPVVASSTGTVIAAAATDAMVAAEGTTLDDAGISAPSTMVALDRVEALFDESPQTSLAAQAGLLNQPGQASGVITIEGLARISADTPQGRNRRLAVLLIEPSVTVGVVLVGLGLQAENALAAVGEVAEDQTVRDALAEGGWTGAAALTNGMPQPDLVYALREELG